MSHNADSRSLSRREFLRRAGLGLGAVALAGCTAPMPAPEGDSVAAPAQDATVLSFLTQGGNEQDFARYEPLFETFQEANPDITIEPIWEPGGAIEIQTRLLTLIAAGDAPDTYWAHSYTNAGLAVRNIQMDLVPYLEADDDISGDDFLPAAWLDFQIEGRQIGFPRETTSTVLIYNQQLFDENGLDYPTEDWTWADFAEAASVITTGEGSERIYGTADWNLNRNTWIKMWQKGGDVLSEDRTEFTMNQEPSVAQVAEIQSWHHEQGFHLPATVMEQGGFTTGDLFTTGRIGMFPQFSVFDNVLQSDFPWDIAHIPLDAGDTRTTRVASAGHSMYSGTENDEVAWRWMKFVGSEEAFSYWVGETGLNVPSLVTVAEDLLVSMADALPDSAQIMLDAFDYGRPEQVAGDWIGVHREVQPALDSIYGVQQADPQEALDAIADRVVEFANYVPGE